MTYQKRERDGVGQGSRTDIMPTAISLFSGIGGIDLAASAVGFDILAQVEIKKFCRRVLQKHAPTYWRNAVLHKDVHDVGSHNLPYADLLFGGFPCKNVSTSGKRAGIQRGNSSGLWFEFRRIIGDIRPRFVMLENVGNIANLGGTIVVGDLAALGYDALWLTIRASDVGAAHKRERWFCIAYTHRVGNPSESRLAFRQQARFRQRTAQSRAGLDKRPQRSGVMEHARRPGCKSTPKSATQSKLDRATVRISSRLDRLIPIAPPNQGQYEWEEPRIISPYDSPNRRHRIEALGNAVVPQQVEPILQAIYDTLTGC